MSSSFKKLLLGAAIVTLGNVPAFSQDLLVGLSNNTMVGVLSRAYDNRYQGVRGTPYFANEWLPGTLVIKKGNLGNTEEYKNLMVKYDVHANELVVVPKPKDTLLISANIIHSFKVDMPIYGGPIEFRTLAEARTLDPALTDVFFAVLYDGKTKLVKRVSKQLVPANFKGPYSSGITYDELVNETHYYLVKGNGMVKTKLTRKALLDALPAQQEKLKAYITTQKLAMNSEMDFIKVLAYQEGL